MMEISEILNKLSSSLKTSRYNHSVAVGYTAASLAMRYGYDVRKALIAGLIHDCAKAYSDTEFIEIATKENIAVSDTEKLSPQLLHAKIGPVIAKKQYNIEDEEILSAICFHTTGRPDMTLLEKIVFVSDYIEPGRDKDKDLEKLRQIAFDNIDKAIYLISRNTLEHLKTTDFVIDKTTEKTYEFYKELFENGWNKR